MDDLRNPGTRNGSTVYAGGYVCECFDCYHYRNRPDRGQPNRAAWSCWRIHEGVVRCSWIMCDSCLPQSRAAMIGNSLRDPRDVDIYLPLLHPSDAYARIAVEEMLYALTALGPTVRDREKARICKEREEAYGSKTWSWQ